MKVLVVGSGGREHALAWKLSQEHEVLCAPGNAGIERDVEAVCVSAQDHQRLIELCRDRRIDLVVVGPENPLIDGLADELRTAGVAVFGPGRAGAQLEASKTFSKVMMARANVPTAAFSTFTDPASAKEFAKSRFEAGQGVAVKASGNALGKGVVVAETLPDAERAIDDMMVARLFGHAGEQVVIEDRLVGKEFSLLTIVGDQNFVSLPVAQDYKRAYDGDQGPNTGGVGSYSPTAWVTKDLVAETEALMVSPILRQMRLEGIEFRGTLFSGVMVTEGGPLCLEYNVRFGDPETQSVMCRLGGGFGEALFQAATGDRIEAPEVLDNHVVSVVVCASEYPQSGAKALPIAIDPLPENVRLFHAGTRFHEGRLEANGGRIVTVTAVANQAAEARDAAYRGAACVQFEGARYRSDIALA